MYPPNRDRPSAVRTRVRVPADWPGASRPGGTRGVVVSAGAEGGAVAPWGSPEEPGDPACGSDLADLLAALRSVSPSPWSSVRCLLEAARWEAWTTCSSRRSRSVWRRVRVEKVLMAAAMSRTTAMTAAARRVRSRHRLGRRRPGPGTPHSSGPPGVSAGSGQGAVGGVLAAWVLAAGGVPAAGGGSGACAAPVAPLASEASAAASPR